MPQRFSLIWLRLCLVALGGLGALCAHAQQRPDTTKRPDAPIRNIQLENVEVSPTAINTKSWLLLDKEIQLELDGAVRNLYNFKYDKAEKQFRSLRRRYPEHPMPYFLLGLSQWWKIVPSNVQTKLYDKVFFAYMDTTISKGETLYKQDKQNYEACFFLSAAYGFAARLNAERANWRKATVYSKEALDYLARSQEANGLSPEFLFGQALFNYYQVWIAENYPLLRPVMLFFPKGNRDLGLRQLRNVADNGFYTGTEAKFFLMKILYNDENKPTEALPVARDLAANYPDNAYFQRFYALACYNRGEYDECERVSREILEKLNKGMPGYEAISGRYATYFLGWLMEHRYDNSEKAAEYFQRCIVFAESTGETEQGFYVLAHRHLARIAADRSDVATARRYYNVVKDKAPRNSPEYREARAYLKQHKK
ncbi:tetratricopeptide repeat protein [Hymenobacter latericus]|uniref:tetratricopeptide repeat protein n=1 Tax=Hymenobacter sp. YIM 151858-1 TaxID=2987688 RepID=UPI0022262BC8|nr:tetratricopeptide repeat protein [Hymenobacter sp. YIM 151858-1]UYZ59402.1 tetratricopeptide repeat protein [Hymenobacter sp. YIM 151858-1]